MITVIGGGMGVAAAYALAVLGNEVELIDNNPAVVDNANSLLNISETEGRHGHVVCREGTVSTLNPKTTTVLSCAPYTINYNIAHHCISRGIRYADLGGNINVGKSIYDFAQRHATKPVFTDLGLAPGLANILALNLLKTKCPNDVNSVLIAVGGLPIRRPFYQENDYALTWSAEGLYNEYVDNCAMIKDGEIASVPALELKENVPSCDTFKSIQAYSPDPSYKIYNLEMCTTSGGLAHIEDFQKLGVKNCVYKTIRYEGHFDKLKLLLSFQDAKQFKESIAKLYPYQREDAVLIYIRVEDPVLNSNIKIELTSVIKSDIVFTAMQRATGFGAAAIVHVMHEGLFDKRKTLTYTDVPMECLELMMRLGLL